MSGRMCKSRQFKEVGPFLRVKETKSESWVEWMNFCIMCSSWTLSSIINIDQILLLFCVDAWVCNMGNLKRAGMAWLHLTDKGSKSWRSFLLSSYVSGSSQLLVFHRTGMLQQRPTCIGQLQGATARGWNSHWQTHRKSATILCQLIFWNVIYSWTTKWWTNLNIRVATQNSV